MALSNAERQKAYRERKKAEKALKELDQQAPKEVQEELCNELMRQVPPPCVVEGHPDDLPPVKIESETITYFDVYKRRHDILDNTSLPDDKVRQVIKDELENPCAWHHPDHDNDPDPDWAIKNYYLSLYLPHVFANWCDHIHARYGIAYSAHLVR